MCIPIRAIWAVLIDSAVVGIGGSLAAPAQTYPTYTYRYRMQVSVQVGDQLKTGSSVIQVRLERQPPGFPNAVVQTISGEAVFVELGAGRNVLALLGSGPNSLTYDYPAYVVPRHFKLDYTDSDLPKFPSLQGSWALSAAEMPTLVSFADINDPKSARVLDPQNLAATLGADVSLKDIVVEMTDAPVTRRIFSLVPWLRNFSGLTGGQNRPDWSKPEKNLTAILFSRGAVNE